MFIESLYCVESRSGDGELEDLGSAVGRGLLLVYAFVLFEFFFYCEFVLLFFLIIITLLKF